MYRNLTIWGVFLIIIAGCGGNDEIGLTSPTISQQDLFGIWFQSYMLDGNQVKFEKYDTTGLFVYIDRGRNDTGTFRFLKNLDIERIITSSKYYSNSSGIWIKQDISKIKPDTINFHLNSSGFWVRGYTLFEDKTLYTREWRKVDSLPYLRP